MVEPVDQGERRSLVGKRLREILRDHLGSQLDSDWSRAGSSPPTASDGVPLPDPDRYYVTPEPSLREVLDVDDVGIWVGPSQPARTQALWQTAGDGDLGMLRQRFGARVIVRQGAADVSHIDPGVSRSMSDHELLAEQAARYSDSMAAVLQTYGHPTAMSGTSPDREDTIRLVGGDGVTQSTPESASIPAQGPDGDQQVQRAQTVGTALVQLEVTTDTRLKQESA